MNTSAIQLAMVCFSIEGLNFTLRLPIKWANCINTMPAYEAADMLSTLFADPRIKCQIEPSEMQEVEETLSLLVLSRERLQLVSIH